MKASFSFLFILIFIFPSAQAHVIQERNSLELEENLILEFQDCSQNRYGSVLCRFLVHNKENRLRMSPKFYFEGSRFTDSDYNQVQFKSAYISGETFQSANSDYAQFQIQPLETVSYRMAVQSTLLPKYAKGAVFPEIKLMVDEKPVYFSGVKNK